MKTRLFAFPALACLSMFCFNPSPVFAQGTAFTFQGQLQNNAIPASGTYNLTFSLFNTNTSGVPIAGPVTNNGVIITNGIFTVLIDFGPGVFVGATNWLQIGVATNGVSSFTALTPRQQLTPVPYSIHAEGVTASGITGTLTDAQLAHSAITVNAGPGLSGGGSVSLGNAITLTNTGVLSVTGNADIAAATVGGAVTLGDTATSTDTPNLIVKRDGSGNFSAATITLDGNLNLPATTATAGVIYSGGVTMIHAHGSQNFFAGPAAGNLTMSGINSTANGYHALFFDTTGSDDTAIGTAALLLNTSGSDNTASGTFALFNNTSGAFNTANGSQALYNNTSGSNNTAVGFEALYWNTGDNLGLGDGSYNTASGYQALYNNTEGVQNTANGAQALFSNTNGTGNTGMGYAALYSNMNGSGNTADGFGTLYNNTGGSYNTASGSDSLYSNTSGSDNTASGAYALLLNTGGSDNTANGVSALYSNTNGSYNTANGYQALYSNTGDALGDGSANTASGYLALYANTIGTVNTASGANALSANTTGSQNTANGSDALGSNTSGNNNTASGFQALAFTTGSGNIALGYQAGLNLTVGSDNIDIGHKGSTGEGNIIRIGTQGTQTNTFIAGIFGTTVSGSTVTVNSSGQVGLAPSSRRFKRDIQSMDEASSVLLSLRPVTFKYKPDIDPQGAPQFGLVAEEVAKVDPDLVVRDGKGQIFTVRYEAVNAMLLNEFLKQHRTVEEQNVEINTLKEKASRVDSLEKRLNALEQVVHSLAEKK